MTVRPIVAVALAAGVLLACGTGPVEPGSDGRLTLSADSVVLGVYESSLLGYALVNASGPPQYVSRDQAVASVSVDGAVTGVGVGSTYVVATPSGRPDVRDSVRVRVHADSCSGVRPDFGGAATAADRQLFSYDVNAPLNFQKTVQSTSNGVEMSSISYNSPDGGIVTGLMWDPVTRSSLRPGMVLMHGHPSNAATMTGMAQGYAQYGAVVIAIDAPFARRTVGSKAMTLLPQDRDEQIQVIKELQRAVDILRSRPNIDDDRIAYVGVSWGGATGALFVGIERRLKAAALVVGHPGQVSHATGPGGFRNITHLSCIARLAWIRAMTPVEPVRYVGNANVPLLLQNGRFDLLIPEYEAQELHVAAPQPKTVLWYSAGHNLVQQAVNDRHDWLVEKIGIDPR